MEKIKFLLQELEKENPDWKDYFSNQSLHYDAYADHTKELIGELIKVIRSEWQNYIDAGDMGNEEKWWQAIVKLLGASVAENISDELDESVKMYRHTKILRSNKMDVAAFLLDVFGNVSVHYNPLFFHMNEKYHIQSTEEFVNCILAIDHITDQNVRRNYSKLFAQKEFEKFTGVTAPNSMVYAELYEKEFDKIQRNFYMNRLEMINIKLDALLDKIAEED